MPRREDNDSLLADLLHPRASGEARDAAIQEILVQHAMPLVEELLQGWVARGSLAPVDVGDVKGDVAVRLLRKLRRLIDDPAAENITRLLDYVDATVHNALYDHQRRRHPLHSRLASRVRYVLTHTAGVDVWGRDPVVCGLEAWKDRAEVLPAATPENVLGSVTEDAKELRRAALDILRRSGGPVAFDELVARVAAALPLATEPFLPETSVVDSAPPSNPLSRLEGRQYLARLWKEIVELPVRQRRALLLQLRLDDGESVARLLPVLRIADVRTLAATLEMPLAELLALWNDLPLMDQRIAGLLGVTRQQVINLRKSARERLSRRVERGSGS